MKFKHGDIVSIKGHKNSRMLVVALYVNLRKNPELIFSCEHSGIYLFRGQWYGNNPLNIKSHGKNEGSPGKWNKGAYKVGHVSSFKNIKFN